MYVLYVRIFKSVYQSLLLELKAPLGDNLHFLYFPYLWKEDYLTS